MIININEEIKELETLDLLNDLLIDHTTNQNIIWASDAFEYLGDEFKKEKELRSELILINSKIILNRFNKHKDLQISLTKKHAEVFTPLEIVNQMINYLDNIFYKNFKKHSWKDYISNKILEITCGEAPFLTSRYNLMTGEFIDIPNRVGILDRKIKIISQNVKNEKEWLFWIFKAFESIYGYEIQGNNVLIARVNLLKTFQEYLKYYWNREPSLSEYKKLINIITWNIWQMDGLSYIPPFKQKFNSTQLNLFSTLLNNEDRISDFCKIYDWKDNEIQYLNTGKEKQMKFDFIIGNPPYQDDKKGTTKNANPIYHYFIDETQKLSDRVELIHPARFLFNAGGTPSDWNKKMLNDPHLKVLEYQSDSRKFFQNVDIKGGIAITYWDKNKNFEPIIIFTVYPELHSILKKVLNKGIESLSKVITNRGIYRYSNLAYSEQPEELKKTADQRIAPSSFTRMPNLFIDEIPEGDSSDKYIKILGNIKGKRFYKWFKKDYIENNSNLNKYKVLIAKANGTGAFGEKLSQPIIAEPNTGFTETYISIGQTENLIEAEAVLKYLKCKFTRAMLGILKVTQNNAKPTWKFVPLQNFTVNSDIDWSKSVSEIDHQLYQKYNLSNEEIEFIETHVKEME